MEVEFTVDGGHPWEKSNPTCFIDWKDNKKPMARQQFRSEPWRLWHNAVVESAKKAMYHNQRLFRGCVAICTVFYIPRPQHHYRTNGSVKDGYLDAMPDNKNTVLHLLHRAVIEALTAVVLHESTQVVKECSIKLYRDTGGCTVKIWNVTKTDLDGSPEQLDFGLEL